jgi:hypothetical protein
MKGKARGKGGSAVMAEPDSHKEMAVNYLVSLVSLVSNRSQKQESRS